MPEVLEDVTRLVAPADFSDPDCARIYATILELRADRLPIDHMLILASVGDEIPDAAGQLAELAGIVPSASNAKYYAAEVKQASMKRKLADARRASDDNPNRPNEPTSPDAEFCAATEWPLPSERPAITWIPRDVERWLLGLEPNDLPLEPFLFHAGVWVTDRRLFLQDLQAQVRLGLDGPRAVCGSLQYDVERLVQLVAAVSNVAGIEELGTVSGSRA
jgi:hypothetical protein